MLQLYNKKYLLFILIIVITLIVVFPFGLFFLADDFLHIPESIGNVWMQRNSIRPVGNISLWFNELLFHKNPFGYHLSNLVLHILNSIFVFRVTIKILSKFNFAEAKETSLIVSLFFFTYPFHAETLFWIIGRSGTLGCLFFLISFNFFLKENRKYSDDVLSILSFQLGLYSYESVWIYPLIITLVLVLFKQEITRQNFIYIVATSFVFALHLFFRIKTTGELFNNYDASSFTNFNLSLLFKNFLQLVARSFLPPFYNSHYFTISFVIIAVINTILFLWLYKTKKLSRIIPFLFISWAISYLPYLSLGVDTHGTEGERYLYLPSAFLCILFGVVLQKTFRSKVLIYITTLICCINVHLLYKAKQPYLQASNITQTTLHHIKKNQEKESIFFQNLPQYHGGAVVFRIGLENAIQWFYPNFKSNIILVSKDSSDEIPKKYLHQFFTVENMSITNAQPFKSILQKDTSYKQNYISKDTAINSFTGEQAIFMFSDSVLKILQ